MNAYKVFGIILGTILLYFLSSAPALRFASGSQPPIRAVSAMYHPIGVLCDFSPAFGRVYRWYLQVWMPDLNFD